MTRGNAAESQRCGPRPDSVAADDVGKRSAPPRTRVKAPCGCRRFWGRGDSLVEPLVGVVLGVRLFFGACSCHRDAITDCVERESIGLKFKPRRSWLASTGRSWPPRCHRSCCRSRSSELPRGTSPRSFGGGRSPPGGSACSSGRWPRPMWRSRRRWSRPCSP